MPARHTSLPDSLLLEADFKSRLWSTKEGVGETSGQTAGSSLWGVRSSEPVRQKKQVFFVRCGSLRSAISPGRKARLRSGPDVFADALVPCSFLAGADSARYGAKSDPPKILDVCPDQPRPQSRGVLCVGAAATRSRPMVIVSPNGTVNQIPEIRGKPCKTEAFAISPACTAADRLRRIHPDI